MFMDIVFIMILLMLHQKKNKKRKEVIILKNLSYWVCRKLLRKIVHLREELIRLNLMVLLVLSLMGFMIIST